MSDPRTAGGSSKKQYSVTGSFHRLFLLSSPAGFQGRHACLNLADEKGKSM